MSEPWAAAAPPAPPAPLSLFMINNDGYSRQALRLPGQAGGRGWPPPPSSASTLPPLLLHHSSCLWQILMSTHWVPGSVPRQGHGTEQAVPGKCHGADGGGEWGVPFWTVVLLRRRHRHWGLDLRIWVLWVWMWRAGRTLDKPRERTWISLSTQCQAWELGDPGAVAAVLEGSLRLLCREEARLEQAVMGAGAGSW